MIPGFEFLQIGVPVVLSLALILMIVDVVIQAKSKER